MKPFVVGACLLVLVSLAAGQDRLSRDEARRYAKLCVEQLGRLDDAQIQTDVDAETATAVRGEGGGAMVVPDKKLSKEKLAAAGKDVVPLGQVWLRKWTVVVGGKAVANDKLRVVTIKVDDKDRPMPLLLVGVRKKGKNDLEMVVYAKDSKPLLTLPLKPVDFVQELPVELEWQRGEKSTDLLTLTVLGKYQAVLPVTRQ
jgi:hypothetical protein